MRSIITQIIVKNYYNAVTTKTDSIDRDRSSISFNSRVLALAESPTVPLLERLRYLCIVTRNIDEFFEIRMAELFNDLSRSAGAETASIRAQNPRYLGIVQDAHALVKKKYQIFARNLLPDLASTGIRLISHRERTKAQRKWVEQYFKREVAPLLTPITLDPAHPFPQIANKSLNFIVELREGRSDRGPRKIAIVRAPRSLPRVVEMPKELCTDYRGFVLLTSIIRSHLHSMWPSAKLIGYSQFRVTRDSDLWLDELDVKDIRAALRSKLDTRSYGRAVRLEVSATCPQSLVEFLQTHFGLLETDTYRVAGPVNLVRLDEIVDRATTAKLRFPAVRQRFEMPGSGFTGFAALAQKDLLLHHPFDSFQPVLDFLVLASNDAAVVSIKITVYRIGTDSALMQALLRAAKRGVDVLVVLELRARFDEETNIDWAEQLERVGVQVIYGAVGLKTHAKMCLVTRREHGGLRLYAHLSTGNYNAITSKRYTDFGLLTAQAAICEDVSRLFQQLAAGTRPKGLAHLWAAPTTLHEKLVAAIRFEAAQARRGERGRIVAKMNALVEPTLVEELYKASQCGVKIDLIVRGACILRPGIANLSENVTVRSVVGRFLEHSRIFGFFRAGDPLVLLSSADWMGRNLFRRIEVAFPITDRALMNRVLGEGIEPYLRDETAWVLGPDGEYSRDSVQETSLASAQEWLLRSMVVAA
jgi:polyphosphate kinase